MSTRSRANPWFRPIRPIADAVLEGILADGKFEGRVTPSLTSREDALYRRSAEQRTRALVLDRLSTKWILTARLLDPEFDARCRELCPELPPLDPVTTNELRKVMERRAT